MYNIGITLKKAFFGAFTFLSAYVASNPEVITNLVPENILTMTIGSIITAVIVAVTNFIKNVKN